MHRLAAGFEDPTDPFKRDPVEADKGGLYPDGEIRHPGKIGNKFKAPPIPKKSGRKDIKTEADNQFPDYMLGKIPRGKHELSPLFEDSDGTVGTDPSPNLRRHAFFKDDATVAGAGAFTSTDPQEAKPATKEENPESAAKYPPGAYANILEQKNEQGVPGTVSPKEGVEDEDKQKKQPLDLNNIKVERGPPPDSAARYPSIFGAIPRDNEVQLREGDAQAGTRSVPGPPDSGFELPPSFGENSRMRLMRRAIQYLSSVSPSLVQLSS